LGFASKHATRLASLSVAPGAQLTAACKRFVCEDAHGLHQRGALRLLAWAQRSVLRPPRELTVCGELQRCDLIPREAVPRRGAHTSSRRPNSISSRSPRRCCGGSTRLTMRSRPWRGSSTMTSIGCIRSAARRAAAPRRRATATSSARSTGSTRSAKAARRERRRRSRGARPTRTSWSTVRRTRPATRRPSRYARAHP
jgi:hypothetical protein